MLHDAAIVHCDGAARFWNDFQKVSDAQNGAPALGLQ